MSAIKVIDKAVNVNGHEMWVKFLEIDGVQGWCANQVREYFGFATKTGVHDCAKRAGVGREVSKLLPSQVRELKQIGILSTYVGHQMFYTREQIKKMAAYAATPEARSMVEHAMDVTEAVYTNNVESMVKLTSNADGTNTVLDTNLIRKLCDELDASNAKAKAEEEKRKLAEAAQKQAEAERKQAEATITNINGNAVSYAIKMGYKAWQIVTGYPEAAEEALSWGRAIGIYPFKGYEKQGVMTRWLREVHDIHSVSSRVDFSSKRGDTALYDRNVIDKLMEKLGYVKKGTQS